MFKGKAKKESKCAELQDVFAEWVAVMAEMTWTWNRGADSRSVGKERERESRGWQRVWVCLLARCRMSGSAMVVPRLRRWNLVAVNRSIRAGSLRVVCGVLGHAWLLLETGRL